MLLNVANKRGSNVLNVKRMSYDRSLHVDGEAPTSA